MTAPFRYSRLGYVALNVTDVARTSEFTVDIVGLTAVGDMPGGAQAFRCSRDHHNLLLCPASEAGLKRTSWELEDEENVLKAHAHFEAIGLKPTWVEAEEAASLGILSGSPVFRMREPHGGACFEFFAKLQQKGRDFTPTHTKIVRLGHVAYNVADCKTTSEFFEENMGFLVSDHVGDHMVSLMRAFPNPLHHSLGIGQSRTGKSGFNHMNFMVTDIDDIGRAYYRLKENNVDVVFGIGRHPTSDSIFIYFLDPDGLTWEYSFGMELFPEEGARAPRFMSVMPEDFDLWGARPTADFAAHGNVEQNNGEQE